MPGGLREALTILRFVHKALWTLPNEPHPRVRSIWKSAKLTCFAIAGRYLKASMLQGIFRYRTCCNTDRTYIKIIPTEPTDINMVVI